MVSPKTIYGCRGALNKAATVDDFIDVIMKDHRKYIKW